jgi:phosphatidylglycerophosphate synthase
MKLKQKKDGNKVLKTISNDRTRTNLIKKPEHIALVFLVQRIPSWINSDMLTFIGLLGSVITLTGFILAAHVHAYYFLLCVLGLAINWFGDSLDGRLAFYRNKPRQWYGFTLDIIIDWISIILIGLGYLLYVAGNWKLAGFGLIVLYGWSMLITLLRYKVTGKYIIDSGLFGPTEVRILIAFFLILEMFFKDIILYSAALACMVLFFINIADSYKLLKIANEKDMAEQDNSLHGQRN